MEHINANHVGDEHARYQMSRLEAKQDGRSKICKTWLVNLPQIASQLHLSPEVLLLWLSHAKGATGGCDRSSGVDRWFLKGHHDPVALQRELSRLCTALVVCPKCDGCDTSLCAICAGGTKKRPEYQVQMSCDSSGCVTVLRGLPQKLLGKLCRLLPDKPRKRLTAVQPAADLLLADDQLVEDDDWEWSVSVSPSAAAERRAALLGQNQTAPGPVPATDKPTNTDQPLQQEAIKHAQQLMLAATKRSDLMRQLKTAVPLLVAAELSGEHCLQLLLSLPPHLAKHAGSVLCTLYDHELVDETTILVWHANADHGSAIVIAATEFIEFLTAM